MPSGHIRIKDLRNIEIEIKYQLGEYRYVTFRSMNPAGIADKQFGALEELKYNGNLQLRSNIMIRLSREFEKRKVRRGTCITGEI